jgi:hypothetical protein
VVRGEGGAVVEVPPLSGLVAGQSSRREELLTQRGGPTLSVSGDGFDSVSAQKKEKNTG